MVPKYIILVACLLIGAQESQCQSLQDKIQQLFQQSVINPIRDKVHEGVKGIADALLPSSYNSSENKSVPMQATFPVPPEFQLPNDSLVPPSGNETYPDPSPTSVLPSSSSVTEVLNGISPVTESGDGSLPISSLAEDLDGNTTVTKGSRALENTTFYLSAEALMELKELCPHLSVYEDDKIARDFRYHPPSGNCSKVLYKGPCGLRMKLFIEEIGSINGTCECAASNRISIYHDSTNACYEIFTQGYCPEGEWLDLTREGKAVCEPNPCVTPGKDKVKVGGKCVEVNRGSDICPDDKMQVIFVKGKRNPECKVPVLGTIGVPTVPCSPGNSLALHGKCHVSQWDFGDDGTGDEGDNSKY